MDIVVKDVHIGSVYSALRTKMLILGYFVDKDMFICIDKYSKYILYMKRCYLESRILEDKIYFVKSTDWILPLGTIFYKDTFENEEFFEDIDKYAVEITNENLDRINFIRSEINNKNSFFATNSIYGTTMADWFGINKKDTFIGILPYVENKIIFYSPLAFLTLGIQKTKIFGYFEDSVYDFNFRKYILGGKSKFCKAIQPYLNPRV